MRRVVTHDRTGSLSTGPATIVTSPTAAMKMLASRSVRLVARGAVLGMKSTIPRVPDTTPGRNTQ